MRSEVISELLNHLLTMDDESRPTAHLHPAFETVEAWMEGGVHRLVGRAESRDDLGVIQPLRSEGLRALLREHRRLLTPPVFTALEASFREVIVAIQLSAFELGKEAELYEMVTGQAYPPSSSIIKAMRQELRRRTSEEWVVIDDEEAVQDVHSIAGVEVIFPASSPLARLSARVALSLFLLTASSKLHRLTYTAEGATIRWVVDYKRRGSWDEFLGIVRLAWYLKQSNVEGIDVTIVV